MQNRNKKMLSLVMSRVVTSMERRELVPILGGVSAGFPSPAEDFREERISLDQELIKDKDSTYFARVNGDSMEGAGISDGDLLVVDKSKVVFNGCIAVCFIDGEFTVKRIQKTKEALCLVPENPKYKTLEVGKESDLRIWGVVTYVIKDVRKSKASR